MNRFYQGDWIYSMASRFIDELPEKHLEKNSFFEEEIDENDETEVGDVLLMDTTNTGKLDHVALYVGDQTILHHCVKRLSSRETYDQKWIECTKKRYRYAQ